MMAHKPPNLLRDLRTNDDAAMSLSGIGTAALGTAAVIVGAVVGLLLIANLSDDFIGGVRDLSENVSTADWGDDTANSLSPTFAMLISLGGLFSLVAVGFVAYSLNKRG